VFRLISRVWLSLVFVVISVPLIAWITIGSGSLDEKRSLAEPPTWPSTWETIKSFPAASDAYLRDHFGLREWLVGRNTRLRVLVDGGNQRVLVGKDDWMFLYLDKAVLQSTGILRRVESANRFAREMADLKEALASRDIRFLVAIAPNGATIYEEYLPAWLSFPSVRTTEYDLIKAGLAQRGVTSVDLRAVLLAAKQNGKLYRKHDSHWTTRGSLIAFNAIAESAGLASWKLPVESTLGAPRWRSDGDLISLLGIGTQGAESDEPSTLPLPNWEVERFPAPIYPTYIASAHRPGKTIMIIGDSFTMEFFQSLVMQQAARLIWTHHRFCEFDMALLEREKPDQVWYISTERYAFCVPGLAPEHFVRK
jgi:hypothetical protein